MVPYFENYAFFNIKYIMRKIKILPLVTYSYRVKIFSIIGLIFSITGLMLIKQINPDIFLWTISFFLFLILHSKEKNETEKVIKLRNLSIQFTYKYLISLLLALKLTEIWSGVDFQFNIVFIVLISLTIQLAYFYLLIAFTDSDCKFVRLPLGEYLNKYYYFLVLILLPFFVLLIVYLIV